MEKSKVMKIYDPDMREWFIGVIWRGLDGRMYVERCGGEI